MQKLTAYQLGETVRARQRQSTDARPCCFPAHQVPPVGNNRQINNTTGLGIHIRLREDPMLNPAVMNTEPSQLHLFIARNATVELEVFPRKRPLSPVQNMRPQPLAWSSSPQKGSARKALDLGSATDDLPDDSAWQRPCVGVENVVAHVGHRVPDWDIDVVSQRYSTSWMVVCTTSSLGLQVL
ncbi:uncharacterized protein BDW70DRAFT_164847 [Aspergillus foveolatus]|uniref:uncharacterized protein n=1 Tax=Aspergillus foveolatus TaxID=210207 RepID=UPI003CCDD206